jgi:hypothetical protein
MAMDNWKQRAACQFVDPKIPKHSAGRLRGFGGKREIGCGDGRLTWRYADRLVYVALDPEADDIERRLRNALPTCGQFDLLASKS